MPSSGLRPSSASERFSSGGCQRGGGVQAKLAVSCAATVGVLRLLSSYAKSAATLLALGATQVFMGVDAEMGPLDAQLGTRIVRNGHRRWSEVQALERLHSDALEQLDATMVALVAGTGGKRTELLLPIACGFVSDLMAPLLHKIDTVHYAKQSRILKVAQDYLERLLIPNFGPAGKGIADQLVNRYPEHGFVIDRAEMGAILGRDLKAPSTDARDAIKRLDEVLWSEPRFVAVGKLEVR